MKNLFIVFEGIDGSGTSTQTGLLQQYFVDQRQPSVVTAEPSEGPIGNLIRQALKKRVMFTEQPHHFEQQMAYLFAADRHDHLYNETDGMLKHIKAGSHVICTRYFFSSYAYHCEHEDDFAFVQSLNQHFPDPDIVIYIDNPVELSLSRINERAMKEIYETKDKLEKVKANFERIFAAYKGKLCRVNGEQDVQSIHQQIVKYIEQHSQQA